MQIYHTNLKQALPRYRQKPYDQGGRCLMAIGGIDRIHDLRTRINQMRTEQLATIPKPHGYGPMQILTAVVERFTLITVRGLHANGCLP
jgi:hypothetical protein